jgi:hypothetical protein
MKNLTLHAPLFAVALLVTAPVLAQTPAAPAPAGAKAETAASAEKKPVEIVKINDRNYVHTATFPTAQENRNFVSNVNQGIRVKQLILELRQRQGQAFTTPEREAIGVRVALLSEQLDKFNKAMEAVGYRTEGEFLLQVKKSRIYIPLTEEGYKRLFEADRTSPGNIYTQTSKDAEGKEITQRYKFAVTLDSVEANDKFNEDVAKMKRLRNYFDQLSATNSQPNLSAEDRKNVTEALNKAEAEITALNEAQIKKYSFSLAGIYQETEVADLFLLVTPEIERKVREHNEALKPTAASTPAKP